MKLKKSFRLALNMLLHSKLRSWLTIIGIVIGVAAIVAITSIGEGAKLSVEERMGSLGMDMITISPGADRASGGFRGGGFGREFQTSGRSAAAATATTTQNITNMDLQVVKSIEGIAFVNGVVSGRADVFYLAESSSISIKGVDTLQWKSIVTTELEAGRYLGPGDTNVIVVGNRVAKSMFKQTLNLNRAVTIEGHLFKIVGILKEASGFGGEDNQIIMPIQPAREILDNVGEGNLDSITLKVHDAARIDEIMNKTTERLMLARHLTARNKDFTVSSTKATQERIQGVTETFTLFLGAIAAVSLLVGAVGIANTMFTSVLEKTKEIGIMKAIGAKNVDIMIIFLLNSGLVGLVGGILGMALGAVISTLLPNLLTGLGPGGSVRTVIPISLLIGAILVAVTIGIIAGAIPAYRASKLKPVDALRYE